VDTDFATENATTSNRFADERCGLMVNIDESALEHFLEK